MLTFDGMVITNNGDWLGTHEKYHVYTSATHGSVTATPNEAYPGTVITLSNTPDEYYEFDYYTVDGIQIVGNTFVMPKHDVTVTATFKLITSPVYVNRLNDLRHNSDYTLIWLAPYMTMFENQSTTPRTGAYGYPPKPGGWNIGTVTPNGSMPASYAGMPEAKFKDESYASYCGYLLETSSLDEYTWGIWVKTGAEPESVNSTRYIGCIGYARDYRNGKFLFKLMDVNGGSYSDLNWGNTTVQKFNGATGSEFSVLVTEDQYTFGFNTSANTWYYISTYFNRNTHTVEYYINGTLYFRLTNVPDIIFTDTSHYTSSFAYQRNICEPSRYNADVISMAPSFCEYAVYIGKHTEVPTAPLVIS